VTTTLAIVTDGRGEYLARCVTSLAYLKGHIDHVLVIDDSGDHEYGQKLDAHFPLWEVVHHPHRMGLAATVRDAWTRCETDWLFHLEEDFTFQRNIALGDLRIVLEQIPSLAQMCLVRQPAYAPIEQQRGGMPAFLDGQQEQCGRYRFVVQESVFSLNPCLIPADVFRKGWPDSNEAGFTQSLVAEGWKFGYWGAKDDDPAVHHIGDQRSAGWKA